MKPAPRLRNFAACALLVAWGAAPTAQARSLHVDIERVTTPLGRVEGLSLSVQWPEGATQGALKLTAKTLDASELGYRYRDLRWTCALQRESATRWRCDGRLCARGQGEATLAAQWQDGAAQLSLSQARGRLALDFPAAKGDPLRLSSVALPLSWLQPLLAARWTAGRFTTGTLDATLELRSRAQGGSELIGPVAVQDLGLDSADGRIAAAGLDAKGRMNLALLPDATRVEVSTQLGGGELLLGSMYADLPDAPATLDLSLRSAGASRWEIERFDWTDAGVFELSATGALEPAAANWLPQIDARFAMPDLGTAHTRYFESLFGTLGLAGLQASGKLSGRASIQAGEPGAIVFEAQAVDVIDGGGRFALRGLDGDLRWTSANDAVESSLRWGSAHMHDLAFGAANLALRSARRTLQLRDVATLPLFDGSMQVNRFAWTPRSADARSASLDLALDLHAIDLAKLSAALGWPAFPGTLSGRIPGARYADEVLSLDGGFQAEVFSGRVRIDDMTLERPFGVAPTMTASVGFEQLDLQPLTAAFGFGEITGRLDGRISALRVVDWSPVAFDADFHTSPNVKGPRRISQRAVNDLSRVGGGGFVAGLQNQVLKLFETFGYSRIGLKCRLENNVCRMDGVDSSGDGYTIVEGSGLPRITVIGHQRQVDWPVLVARLKAATEGQTPIVN